MAGTTIAAPRALGLLASSRRLGATTVRPGAADPAALAEVRPGASAPGAFRLAWQCCVHGCACAAMLAATVVLCWQHLQHARCAPHHLICLPPLLLQVALGAAMRAAGRPQISGALPALTPCWGGPAAARSVVRRRQRATAAPARPAPAAAAGGTSESGSAAVAAVAAGAAGPAARPGSGSGSGAALAAWVTALGRVTRREMGRRSGTGRSRSSGRAQTAAGGRGAGAAPALPGMASRASSGAAAPLEEQRTHAGCRRCPAAFQLSRQAALAPQPPARCPLLRQPPQQQTVQQSSRQCLRCRRSPPRLPAMGCPS